MNEPHVMALKHAPLKAQKPSQQEVEVSQVFTPPPPQHAAAKMPRKMPKTASSLPLIALLGLLSLGTGAFLRLNRAPRNSRD
jgi:hypothetical protein